MATIAEWVQGARPRTLPTALSPVVVGTGAAIGAGAVEPARAGLALVVALALVVGVNYANDYSDGVRGTDDDRVGPVRLVGALCIAGAWFYTGGRRPYGYAGLGEVAVFVFFGPVAVLGTALTQGGPPSGSTILASVGVGMLTSAVLVANNLRDIPTDEIAGKRTLAVVLGDARTRLLYATLALGPLAFSAATALRSWPMVLGLLAVPLAVGPVRRVLGGAAGRDLVGVLAATGVLLLGWSAATGVGLALAGLA